MRITKFKFFIGSTTEEIEEKVNNFFKMKLCPGNVINTNLYKLGGVYQYEIIYAVLATPLPDFLDREDFKFK
jgi:hypothetical protein